jgi:hypothetical protein
MRHFVAVAAVALSLASPVCAQQGDVPARAEQWMRRLAPAALSVEPTTHECTLHTNLSCNSSVSDTVNIFGCRTDNGAYFNIHRFFVDANTKITLSTQSFSYSSLLVLTNDAATSILASANAPSGSTATAIYTTTTAGYYVALVGPLADFVTGNYTLSMTCAKVSTCTETSTTICLADRFAVTAAWRTNDGKTGTGTAIRLTSDTGYFTFFSATNVEVVLKVLNACALNSRYWVFAGGLTDVNVTLTVRDTKTGTTKTYTNPLGQAFQPIQDTNALATCP